ncbi:MULTISPECIES: RagB/SusD family nutrient uptake outer membrane protein [Sphingobacterium]|uniref:RagB/SusD family nutrient uptake outer membrane protein n=1 Tax=Sphingobacterium TaxID=28453 RepID=UPI000E9B3749|nr:RagB/SusD family nutrient uptake outer membrane protein [Sphingobacterium multivorum]HAU55412.1 RagB/SusD family nutrient uptake outer membrane protein [Sphingobacterium sp.]HCX55950.1 RagB/SusD family nutrient uptake outer membrane protein [Sphingobacterium sp.]
MKYIYKIGVLTSAVFLLLGCKKDYLVKNPTDQVSPSTVFESINNAKMAVNGLSRLMKRQYLSSQGFNGEGTIKMYYGNYAGNHFSIPMTGWSSVVNFEYFSNPQSTYTYYPWYYYYTIISNANALIDNIDSTPGTQEERDFIKAQALTFRAYSYMMLAQLYGDRWSNSNNGATSAVILRAHEGFEDLPLSTLGQTYEMIYGDLNTAIGLYESSKGERNTANNYEVNKEVAYAIYARAALNKEDYANAEKYAALARAKYPLMSTTDYKAGFSTVNKEWIWSVFDNDQETIYFYSFQSYMAYNSTSSLVRTYPRSISKDLYTKIPTTDIRKGLFLDPVTTGLTFNSLTGQGNAAGLAYIRNIYKDIPANSTAYSYMQFKFNATGMPGVGQTNNFRSSEMLLIEAEAKYKQNKDVASVQALMNELTKTSGRDPNYTCTKTGQDLFNEIKLYRAIELWGEGFDFFDMKRWGDGIARKSFDQGGNFQGVLGATIKPTDNNNWKIVTPARETDFNTLLD